MMISRTIVISCAGMGNRLGLGVTKALVEIDGKPLIIRQLEMLDNEIDIRVVVGYMAEKVIETVRKLRNDVIFVFNHKFKETSTGVSVALASKFANEYVLTLDGDLLIHPDDMNRLLGVEHEFVSGGILNTDDPWMLQTYNEDNIEYVKAFSKEAGNYEWNGISQIKSHKMISGTGYVFHLIEPHLPVPFLEVRTREIDTINDYERAVDWVKNNYY